MLFVWTYILPRASIMAPIGSVGILGTFCLLLSLLVSFRIGMGHRIQLATLHAQAPAPIFVTREDTVRSYFVNISDTHFNVNHVS